MPRPWPCDPRILDRGLVGGVRLDEFIQLTVNGLTLGSVYALIALGYSLVYGILKLLNFAHGDVFMVGTFIGFGVLQLLGGSTDPMLNKWLLMLVITVAAMAGCAALGVTIERFAYRPLRDAPRIAPLISALGVSFFLTYSMQLMFGAEFRDYNIFDLDAGRSTSTVWTSATSRFRGCGSSRSPLRS